MLKVYQINYIIQNVWIWVGKCLIWYLFWLWLDVDFWQLASVVSWQWPHWTHHVLFMQCCGWANWFWPLSLILVQYFSNKNSLHYFSFSLCYGRMKSTCINLHNWVAEKAVVTVCWWFSLINIWIATNTLAWHTLFFNFLFEDSIINTFLDSSNQTPAKAENL